MPVGYISIGSNINPQDNIPSSLIALKKYFGSLTVSSLYESDAVGFDGNVFHNLLVSFTSDEHITVIAETLRAIELAHGRTRNSQKFSARTLDLDLILYGDLIFHEGKLQIPREDIERYAFVLEPLAEIAATLHHPVLKKSYANMWANFDKNQLKQHIIAWY
jgi:2-amino-4-hydroxy-6-hydroxymethyldihydropteridine diphosphokinase